MCSCCGYCCGCVLIELFDCLLRALSDTLDRGLEDAHPVLKGSDEIVEFVPEGAKPCLECSNEHFSTSVEKSLECGCLLGTFLTDVHDGFPELNSGLIEGFACFRDGFAEVLTHADEAPLDPLQVSLGQFGT